MAGQMEQIYEKTYAGLADASVDNMIYITSDGRKIGLNQRPGQACGCSPPGCGLAAC